ncbi:MAG: DUF2971 domain-containing protein [Bacteroidales bacterium]|nr:DUF2971 domain-containing protein [Bacteroidales bacterium]
MCRIQQEIPKGSGFNYIDYGPGQRIALESPLNSPTTLVKFFPLSKNSVDALEKHYLYGSHPLELNDPFDSLRWMFGKDFSKWMFFFQKIGIISFCHPENSSNILMWAHYCNNQGFTIEFDLASFSFYHHGPFPMNYQTRIPQDISYESELIRAFFFLTLKYKLWKYENEWRIFPENEGILKCPKIKESDYPDIQFLDRRFTYDPSCIKEVTLGYRFTFDECNVLDRKNKIISINTSNPFKTSILNAILEKNYPTSLIDSNPGFEFALEKKPVEISKISELEYRFNFL